jgi:hypothetical protein
MPRGSTRQKEDKQKTTASSSAAKSQAKSNASKGNYGKMSDKAQNKTVGTSNREANIQGSNAAVDRANRAKAAATVAPPAPKAKVVTRTVDNRAGSKNAVVNKGGLGVSQQNRPRIPGTNKPGVKSFGYGYYDQNGEWISPREDAQDGYGPGGSGAKFGGAFGGVSNALGATGYGSGEEATGLAKFIQDGGVLGTMAKGIAGGVKNLVKPATYEVQKNDNLSKIAAANNMTLEQLLAKNPGLDPKAYIQPGQQIKIGGLFGGTQTPEQAAANAAMMAQMDNRDNNVWPQRLWAYKEFNVLRGKCLTL